MEAERRTSSQGLPYLLFRPAEVPAPLIVFLHGWGERAHDGKGLELLYEHSPPRLARDGDLPEIGGRPFPFLLACPQTAHEQWTPDIDRVVGLAEELRREHGVDGVDGDRCYATGVSMGATGVWRAAARSPGTFAALVPVSFDVPSLAREVDAPVWVWIGGDDHWTKDRPVKDHLYAHRPEDERTRFDCVPGAGHERGFWNDVYGRAEIYDWLLRWP